MGIFKKIVSAVLDEVQVYSPTIAELRSDYLANEVRKEMEKERGSYYSSGSNYRSSSKKTTAKKTTSTTPKRLPKPEIPEEEKITMAEFQERTKEACEKLVKKYPDIFAVNRALESKLEIPADEEIYLEHDDTLFRNGMTGFAVTSRGIYCKENISRPQFTDFEELSSYKLTWDSARWTINVNGKKVSFLMPTSDEKTEKAHASVRTLYGKIIKDYVRVK